MASIWQETVSMPRFSPLRRDVHTDVLVIGGGITGILCAYRLREAGMDVCLLEAGRLCGGVTGNTTAKITSQHGLLYHKLLHRFGVERARQYLEANQAALEAYRKLCREIPCDYVPQDSYVYALDNRALLDRELAALDRLGFPAEYVQTLPLPFPTAGAVKFPDQAQFHPLKLLAHLCRGLEIYENTPVRELGDHWAATDFGRVYGKKIIVATHFPILNRHGSYFLKLYQHRSYVLALEQGQGLPGMYLDASGRGLSFRSQGNLLLLGGGSHRTGKKGGGWRPLEDFARKQYPGAPVRYRWATQDCMSLDGMPYIGQYSKRTPDLLVASGFNKWGMTSAMAAAELLTDLVQEKDNPYAGVFSPSRSILRPQLWKNAAAAVENLLTPTVPRCPHMGCALKWNPREHSWDCPCHGSRFDPQGRLLDNPATGDLPNPPKPSDGAQ